MRDTTGWWRGEQAIRLSRLPRFMPRTADGRRVSQATAYRWATAGLRGIRLRRFKSGGSWCTTREELHRWTALLTEEAGGDV